MLARLNQIDGVESSSANGSGDAVRLRLRPGADPIRVAREVERILTEEAGGTDALPPGMAATQLGERASQAALQQEQWRDSGQVAQQAATEKRAEVRRNWLALLLAGAVVLLGLLWWWRRRRADGEDGLRGHAREMNRRLARTL